MVKYTKTTLDKIESIFQLLGYKVRYEKGNFNCGYCIVEDKKIVVVNKFFELQGRIETLKDILSGMELNDTLKNNPLEVFYLKLFEVEQINLNELR